MSKKFRCLGYLIVLVITPTYCGKRKLIDIHNKSIIKMFCHRYTETAVLLQKIYVKIYVISRYINDNAKSQ